VWLASQSICPNAMMRAIVGMVEDDYTRNKDIWYHVVHTVDPAHLMGHLLDTDLSARIARIADQANMPYELWAVQCQMDALASTGYDISAFAFNPLIQ
jgi:hypothetical protein